jgi:hypothetical protein
VRRLPARGLLFRRISYWGDGLLCRLKHALRLGLTYLKVPS